MDEKLQTALAVMIDKSMSGIDAATGFLSVEIPEVVGQLLMWHGLYNLLLAIIGLSILAITGYVSLKYSGKGDKIDGAEYNRKITLTHDDDGNFSPHCMASFSVIICAVVVGSIMINLEWLKIWIAPKVWLIEYVSQLARN